MWGRRVWGHPQCFWFLRQAPGAGSSPLVLAGCNRQVASTSADPVGCTIGRAHTGQHVIILVYNNTTVIHRRHGEIIAGRALNPNKTYQPKNRNHYPTHTETMTPHTPAPNHVVRQHSGDGGI